MSGASGEQGSSRRSDAARDEHWRRVLVDNADGYARVAMTNIDREFPSDIHHTMSGPNDFPSRPRERTPVFYGSYDWHSCVEMHWLLVRLLRTVPEAVPADEVRALLDRQFTADALRAEAEFIGNPANGNRQRPYGWGWALALADELLTWDDPDARRWAEHITPLADVLTDRFVNWFGKADYPIRYGVHTNSAFGLARALPHARFRAEQGDPALLDGIVDRALRWFASDTDYPARFEPSGTDFLSPALTEAELMAEVLSPSEFRTWLTAFLPGLADADPAELFAPATVSDSSDGYIAHLHGLNASRAYGFRRVAGALPADDPRRPELVAAVERHAGAALPHVAGDDYMVEHWLACYAVLLLS